MQELGAYLVAWIFIIETLLLGSLVSERKPVTDYEKHLMLCLTYIMFGLLVSLIPLIQALYFPAPI